MKYNEIKNNLFAKGTVPDGYFGDRASVGFHFDVKSRNTITICAVGCYLTGIPKANDVKEALWLLNNHPSAKLIRLDA